MLANKKYLFFFFVLFTNITRVHSTLLPKFFRPFFKPCQLLGSHSGPTTTVDNHHEMHKCNIGAMRAFESTSISVIFFAPWGGG